MNKSASIMNPSTTQISGSMNPFNHLMLSCSRFAAIAAFSLLGLFLAPENLAAQCNALNNVGAKAWCDDGTPAEEFQYFIEISGAAPGSVNFTITWDSDTENYTGGTIYIGPFNHSMIGGAVQVLNFVDNGNPGCERDIEVLEAVCGFPQSAAFCDCSLNDPEGSLPSGAILAQSEPGTFEAGGSSGRIQKYILADPITGEILEVNMTGLFTGLANGNYKVYAFNYRVEDAAIIENYLLPGQFYSVIEDGINGVGPLASVCYAVCTSSAAEYTVACDNDLNACNAMLMECPTVFSGNEAMFTLSDANDDVACGDATGLTITYHLSQMDAMMDANPLANSYTSGTIDIWARVENANGCFKLALLQLVVKDSPVLVMSGTDEPCTGGFGTATATVVSGLAPYLYEWSTLDTDGPTANSSHTIFASAGTHTVSVTDANGCVAIGQIIINTNLVVADLSLIATGPQGAVCGDEVSVQIKVEDFENIGSLQFSVNWDDTQLQLLGNTPLTIDGDAPVIGTPAADQLTYSWADADFPGYGAGLADGTTILTLNFKVLSNMASGVTVNITGIPTPILADNSDFCTVNVTPFNLVDFDVDKITVTCPADLSVCLEDVAFTLPDGTPANGTFSGTGVTGDQFDPSVAGAGVHIITYTGTDANGCSNTCTFTVTVVDVEMNTLAAIGPVCPEGVVGDILLSAQPFNPDIV